jgi:hypothetical protein
MKRSTERPYSSWASMLTRCRNKNRAKWHRYGGRGISVCKRWLSYDNFLADMGVPPKGFTLERIDNDKGYSKNNCRWASLLEQSNNRGSTILIEIDGEYKSFINWCRHFNCNYSTAKNRWNRGLEGRAVFAETKTKFVDHWVDRKKKTCNLKTMEISA